MTVHTHDAPFWAEAISKNIAETPEGFLICKNVRIARTGTQRYLGEELGIREKSGQIITVHRLPEDVFDPDALASFEGKPLTDSHPSEPVTVNNFMFVAKGHLQNVRRLGDYVVADLIWTDPEAIRKIKTGQNREVSCGYSCVYVPHTGGTYKQTQIRGNHVAVVLAGRAGPEVAIQDSNDKLRSFIPMNQKQAMAALFASYAKDASPEQVAAMLPFVTDGATAEKAPTDTNDGGIVNKLLGLLALNAGKPVTAKDEESEKKEDEEEEKKESSDAKRIAELEKAVKSIADSVKALTESKPKPKTAADLIKEILAGDEEKEEEKAEDEDPDEEKKESSDEEKEEEEKKESSDLAALLKDLKPVIAALPQKDRKKVVDALVGSRAGKKTYAELKAAINSRATNSYDSTSDDKVREIGKTIAKKRNPHYMEQA